MSVTTGKKLGSNYPDEFSVPESTKGCSISKGMKISSSSILACSTQDLESNKCSLVGNATYLNSTDGPEESKSVKKQWV